MLAVEGLNVRIASENGAFDVVSDMALSVAAGETVCIVGESGCGKSMTALALLRLLPEAASVAAGKIEIDGKDFLAMGQHQVEDYRGEKIAMIFQEPLTALNPVLTIGEQIAEGVRQHRKVGKKQAWARAVEVLKLVQMPDPARRATQYPHELSGGMRQRAMIAMALASQPRLLIADEPTTALDVTVQAQVLRLMRDLQRDLGMAILYISHDLGVIARMADDVAVMYMGSIVEQAPVRDLFRAPKHPYTRGLMASVPRIGKRSGEPLQSIGGNVPIPINKPKACGFFPRCPVAMSGICDRAVPPLVDVAAGHKSACFKYPEVLAAAGLAQEAAHVH